MKKYLIIILLLALTGCSQSAPLGKTKPLVVDKAVVGKELIKIEQDLSKQKDKRYKTIEKYTKDGYEYYVDNIVKWNGSDTPEDIGYEIHIKDVDGKVKSIKKMDKELEVITDWHEPQVATSTL